MARWANLALIEHLDLVFGLRSPLRRDLVIDAPLWSMSRPTAYRLVKRVMDRAGIVGAQATGKGLRHGFGVALVTANPPVPLHVISQLMGHSDSKTTEIYLQVLSEERHSLVMNAWVYHSNSIAVASSALASDLHSSSVINRVDRVSSLSLFRA